MWLVPGLSGPPFGYLRLVKTNVNHSCLISDWLINTAVTMTRQLALRPIYWERLSPPMQQDQDFQLGQIRKVIFVTQEVYFFVYEGTVNTKCWSNSLLRQSTRFQECLIVTKIMSNEITCSSIPSLYTQYSINNIYIQYITHNKFNKEITILVQIKTQALVQLRNVVVWRLVSGCRVW